VADSIRPIVHLPQLPRATAHEIDGGVGTEIMAVAKLVYDLSIAFVTGTITGIVTGLIVEYLIRRREKKAWLPTATLLNRNVFEIVNEFIRDTLPGYWKISGTVYEFSDGEIANPLWEFTDKNILTPGSRSHWQFRRNFEAKLPLQLISDTETSEVSGAQDKNEPIRARPSNLVDLVKARTRIEKLFQSYSNVFDPRLRATLGSLATKLDSTITFGSLDLDWMNDLQYRQMYVSMLISLLTIANEVRIEISKTCKEYDGLQEWYTSHNGPLLADVPNSLDQDRAERASV
jgi:hypothetical protein